MARIKKKPVLDSSMLGVNPFTKKLSIPVNRMYKKVMNKFGNSDLEVKDWEATKYTRVFEVRGYKDKMVALPIRSKEMLLWLIHNIDVAVDFIRIDRVDYMKKHKIKSLNTFKDAAKELSGEDKYIMPCEGKPSEVKDVFWINPHYFFKGSRALKYPELVEVKESNNVK